MTKIISIDGIIGAGKSSVLLELEKIDTLFTKAVFLEPFESNPFLPLFYEDQKRWAYTVQSYFFMLRYQQFLHMKTAPVDVVFCERGLLSDRYTFGAMLGESGLMTQEEYDAYKVWFNWFDQWEGLKPDVTFILNESIDQAMANIKKRGRKMEAGITSEYQEALAKKIHDNESYLGKKTWFLSGANLPNSIEGRVDKILMYVDNMRLKGEL